MGDSIALSMFESSGWSDKDITTSLHHASSNGHIAVMQGVLDSGANIDAVDCDGNTALHLAVTNGQKEAMDLLLDQKASESLLNHEESSPLHLAVRMGNAGLLEAFLAHPQVDLLAGSRTKSVLHIVAEDDNLIESAEIIINSQKFKETLLNFGATNNSFFRLTDEAGLTAVHLAVHRGSHKVLDLVLKTCKSVGLSIEQELKFLYSEDNGILIPILETVETGNVEVVKVLLRHGASPLKAIGKNAPALHFACLRGQLDIVKSMVQHSGSEILNYSDGYGKTPLHYAALAPLGSNAVLVYLLCMVNVKVDVTDEQERTPLHLAVQSKNLNSIKQLVDGNADLFLKDSQLLNILHYAVMTNCLDILKCLLLLPGVSRLIKERDTAGDTALHVALKMKANNFCVAMLDQCIFDIKDASGNSCIHVASATGNVTLLKEILKCPNYLKTLNEVNKEGESTLHLAAEGGHDKCIEILLDHGAFSQRCHKGMTAFFHACAKGNIACAKILLNHFQFNFQKDWTDSDGNTCLHFAARGMNASMVKFLLDMDSKICLNGDLQSFLEVAVVKGHVGLVMTALNHTRWQECLDCSSPIKTDHVMSKFIHCMPEAAKLVLDRSLDRAAVDRYHPEYWEKFNFKYLRLKQSCESPSSSSHTSNGRVNGVNEVNGVNVVAEVARDNPDVQVRNFGKRYSTVALLKEMMELGQENLVNHPVVKMYIKLKWRRYGIWVYASFFFLRALLAILVSVYTVLVIGPDRQSGPINATNTTTNDTRVVSLAAQVIRVGGLVLNLPLFAHLILVSTAIGFQCFNFVSNIANWIYALALISNFVFFLTPDPHAVLPAGALACFFSWMMVLIGLGFFSVFGIYIRMFIRITRTVFQVLVISLLLILAFSFAFYILIDTTPSFSKLRYSLVSVFFFMLGEFQQELFVSQDIEGELRYGELVFLFLFVISILLSIIMANLLIGLAVGDIEKIKKNASIERLQILILYFHQIDSTPLFKRYDVLSYVQYPNAPISRPRQVWRYIWRAAKEDVEYEESSASADSDYRVEDKMDCIIEHLEKLTHTVQRLQERQCQCK